MTRIALKMADVERLENTSMISTLAGAEAVTIMGGVCANNSCQNTCINICAISCKVSCCEDHSGTALVQ